MTVLCSSRAKATSSSTFVELTEEGDRITSMRWTIVQGILDSARPPLTGRDVQLIQPHARPGCLQVFGQTKGEFGIVTAVAEKSCLCLGCQADLPVQETYGKDIVADVGGIESSEMLTGARRQDLSSRARLAGEGSELRHRGPLGRYRLSRNRCIRHGSACRKGSKTGWSLLAGAGASPACLSTVSAR